MGAAPIDALIKPANQFCTTQMQVLVSTHAEVWMRKDDHNQEVTQGTNCSQELPFIAPRTLSVFTFLKPVTKMAAASLSGRAVGAPVAQHVDRRVLAPVCSAVAAAASSAVSVNAAPVISVASPLVGSILI